MAEGLRVKKMGLVLRQRPHKSSLEIHGDDNEILRVLNAHRHSKILCDVKLMVDGQEFPAHKGVLAANSNFFLAMFTTEMMEKDKTTVSVESVSAAAMERLLEYMYTGQIQIHVENVLELVEASNFLFMEKVKGACCQFLESIMDVENCLAIFSIADVYSCYGLRGAVMQYINQTFTELAKSETFLKLGKKDVIRFLSSDDIQIENEGQLLDIALNWINYDPERRASCINDLLELLRLPYIHQSHFQVKLDQFNEHHRRDGKKITAWNNNTWKTNARKSYRRVEVIVVTGGCDRGTILDSGICFIPAVQKWTQIPNMQVPRWRHQMVASNDHIFAIGGLRDVCVKGPVIPFAETFNGETNSWAHVTHQPAIHDVEFDSFCAASIESGVLLVGGVDLRTNRCTSRVSCVQFNDGCSNVSQLSPLIFPRAGHCLVTSGERAFAIGGFQTPYAHGSPDGIRSVESYDIRQDVWICVQPMNEPRHSAAAVSLNDQIFICGGCDGENVLKSCEVYDTKLNKWQHIPPMKSSRMRHSAVVHAGRVYVFGGVSVNSGGIALKSVECYHPEENRWTKVPDMPNGRFDHQSHIYSLRYKFVSHVFDVSS